MITITMKRNSAGGYAGFTCMGHAGYGRNGQDIVCASVSVLVINTLNALEELAGVKPEVFSEQESGFIDCAFADELPEKGKLLVDAMVLGLKGIAAEYGGKYVTVESKEV